MVMRSSTNQQISREYQKAIDFFLQIFTQNYDHLYVRSVHDLDNIYIEGLVFFTRSSLETSFLPKGQWNWNKSKNTITVLYEKSIFISFYKLNTRRIVVTDEPNTIIKVWIFEIKFPDQDDKLNFFWCEKGASMDIVPVQEWDLSFLLEEQL